MAVQIKKGIPFDCPMFEVRCTQECVSGGVRHTDKCPYDNFRKKGITTMANQKVPKGYQGVYAKNSSGEDTLIMVTREVNIEPKKGAETMAKNTTKPTADIGNQNSNGNNFQPTFRKYSDMSDSEKAAFRQGAKTSENKVKERLGFVKPKN